MEIFKRAFCEQIYLELSNKQVVKSYNAKYTYAPEFFFDSAIKTAATTPDLLGTRDADAAILVHTYMPELTRFQASDKRLWTYLTHVTFREYVQDRWSLQTDDIEKLTRSIQKRWFAEGGTDRTFEENAIARLWWGAELTHAPWKKSTEFRELEEEDEYIYTKQLFSLQELIKVTMEGTLSRSSRFLIALLAFLKKNPEYLHNEEVGNLMKELNLIAGVQRILNQPFPELYKTIADCAMTLQEKADVSS